MSHKLIDKLSDLSDISGAPTDGQVLTYQSASSDWQPVAAGGGGGGTEQFIQYNKNVDVKGYVGGLLSLLLNPQRTVLVDTVRSGGLFPAGTYKFHYRLSSQSSVSQEFSGMGAGSRTVGYINNFLLGGSINTNGLDTTVYAHSQLLDSQSQYWNPGSYCVETVNTKGYSQTIGLDFYFTAGGTFAEFQCYCVYGSGNYWYNSTYSGISVEARPFAGSGNIYSELLIVTKL